MQKINLFILLAILSGCSLTPEIPPNVVVSSTPAIEQPSHPTQTSIPIVLTPEVTPRVLVSPTTTIEQSPTSAPLTTPTTPLPTQTSIPTFTPTPAFISTNQEDVLICDSNYKKINVQQELKINNYSNLLFDKENNLIIEGWRPRPEPSTLITSSYVITASYTSIGLQNMPFFSARILFGKGEIKPTTGEVNSIALSKLLFNPPCPCADLIEVLSTSPDNNWQIIELSDHSERGFWLIGQKGIFKITEHTEYASWVWADDSSLLWFKIYTGDSAPQILVFDLTPQLPVLIEIPADYQEYLSQTFYSFAFSPKDKHFMAIPLYYDENQPLLAYEFAISTHTIQLLGNTPLNKAKNLEWNEATASYYFMEYENGSTKIKDFYSNKTWVIPDYEASSVKFAISPSLEYIAFGYGAVDGVRIFQCKKE